MSKNKYNQPNPPVEEKEDVPPTPTDTTPPEEGDTNVTVVDGENVNDGDTATPDVVVDSVTDGVRVLSTVGDAAPSNNAQMGSLDSIVENISPSSRVVLYQIREYSKNMATNVEKDITYVAAENKRLFNTLFAMYNRIPGEEFDRVYRAVLQEVRENKTGAWSETTIFGGVQVMELSESQWAGYRRFVRLILDSADAVEFEKQKNHYNWEEALAYQLTDTARDRIQSFYRI